MVITGRPHIQHPKILEPKEGCLPPFCQLVALWLVEMIKRQPMELLQKQQLDTVYQITGLAHIHLLYSDKNKQKQSHF